MKVLAAAPEPTAVLVRTPNWLGDLVVSTGFLRALLQRFPQARVDLVVRAGFEALPWPHRGQVLPYDRRHHSVGAFGKRLRNQGYSHCFILPPSFSSAWMAWQARIRYRIGYGGQGRTVLLRPALWPAAPARSVHLLEEYLGLLKPWMTARPEQFPPRLELDAAWLAAHAAPHLVPDARPVVLAPGAEYGPAKQWPAAHYRALAQTLGRAGWPVVVTGLSQDAALGDLIVQDVPRAVNLCGRTSLPQLVGVLAGAALLVSNDSGAMHLGAALGIRQLALFGSTDPVWTG
ncbi:MAG TPA: lipopolysaccharide heptosyltransferase II, partial [bacterium]|nr:lipopolysaccharide heptosyltransferase II [bacterium]